MQPFEVPAQVHRILFMRHPESVANTQRFFSGRRDVELTEHGVEQREHAVRALVAFHPDRIWTSPLSRCKDMAQMAATELGIPCEVKDDLAEMDFGILESKRFADAEEILKPYGLTFPWASDKNGHSIPAPEAESYEQVRSRCRNILNELSSLSGRTVCISHGGYLRSMMAEIFGIPGSSSCILQMSLQSSLLVQAVLISSLVDLTLIQKRLFVVPLSQVFTIFVTFGVSPRGISNDCCY